MFLERPRTNARFSRCLLFESLTSLKQNLSLIGRLYEIRQGRLAVALNRLILCTEWPPIVAVKQQPMNFVAFEQ